jgi:hypothetical protein
MSFPSFFQNQISLCGDSFHRISKLILPEKKTYSIVIGNQVYKLSPEETLLLSNSAFESNSSHEQPLIVDASCNYQRSNFIPQLKKSMDSLLSLFHDQIQIEISFQEKEAFAFLGKEFKNRSLQQVCNLVFPGQNQFFSLTSDRFCNIL